MNREQRRHPQRAEGTPRRDEPSPAKIQDVEKHGPPETKSVRAKSSGHGKKTADKWNQ